MTARTMEECKRLIRRQQQKINFVGRLSVARNVRFGYICMSGRSCVNDSPLLLSYLAAVGKGFMARY